MNPKRNPNFEILRVLAMFMIVIIHFDAHGINRALMAETESPFTIPLTNIGITNFCLSQYIMFISSVGVNIFVLITGYFMYDKKPKSYRFIRVWFQTLFYGLFFGFLFFILGLADNHTVIKGLVKSLFPLSIGNHWFVRQYLGLMIISPFLNLAIKNLRKPIYDLLMIVVLITGTTVLLRFPWGYSLEFNSGNSFIWFIYLYISGCYLRRFDMSIRVKKYLKFRTFLIVSVCICLISLIPSMVKSYMGGALYPVAYHYNGVSFYLSLIIFLQFKDSRMPNNIIFRMIIRLAPYTFGVYLIHDNSLVRNMLWYGLNWQQYFEKLYFIPLWIGVAIVVFLSCVVIDRLREMLWGYFKINRRLENLGVYIDNRVNFFISSDKSRY